MPMPDYSDQVFFDGVNDDEVTHLTVKIRAIINPMGPELAKGGAQASPAMGEHFSILIRKSEVSTKPLYDQTITGDREYRIKNVYDSGSCWRIVATCNQRKETK